MFYSHDPEVVIAGPAGTGKTRACLEKLHLCCALIAGLRCLMVRKTFASLKASAMVTFDERVQPELDGVKFWGPTKKRPAQYVYPNGSVIVVGGMDMASKVLSTDYDLIYVSQAEELDEEDWDALSTRCRNYRIPWQQLLADVNPDAPTHWLKLRADLGKTVLLESRHEDNPRLYDDQAGEWTEEGAQYMARLSNLSGVRLLRLRDGLWVAAEGMIYQDAWDRRRNLVYRFEIPREWPRYLAIDFGFTNPFVAQWWAADPDGRLYRYREIYYSQRLVEDHARDILRAMGYERDEKSGQVKKLRDDAEPLPYAVVCDHDAEDRATLERHLGMYTVAADKRVKAGIQSVASRLRLAGDGKPRMVFLRDSLVSRDERLQEAGKPCCTEEEIESYVWADLNKEQPVKRNDHGCDAARMMSMYFEESGGEVEYVSSPW